MIPASNGTETPRMRPGRFAVYAVSAIHQATTTPTSETDVDATVKPPPATIAATYGIPAGAVGGWTVSRITEPASTRSVETVTPVVPLRVRVPAQAPRTTVNGGEPWNV